jgi:hypothetical protein
MTETRRDTASFLVRFTQDMWQSEQGEPKIAWRGHIRHIQSDEEIRFTDFSEAVAFMQQQMQALTEEALEALSEQAQTGDKSALTIGIELWQETATRYTDMVFGAMQQTMKQSESIQKQMDTAMQESLQAWAVSTAAGGGPVLTALQALQTQVETLSARIESLEATLRD